MIPRPAISVTPFAAALMRGRVQHGAAIGHGYILLGDHVLAVTAPGAMRMPNGIEADLRFCGGETVLVGDGVLRTANGAVTSGPSWNPYPVPRFRLSISRRPQFHLENLVGRGPGLTPLGDDVLIGYLAGLALSGIASCVTSAWVAPAAPRTTSLSSTLLELAAHGCLPEAAHRLLEDGDPEPLLAFGATSGQGIALGLALAGGTTAETTRGTTVVLRVPLEGSPARYELLISAVPEGMPC